MSDWVAPDSGGAEPEPAGPTPTERAISTDADPAASPPALAPPPLPLRPMTIPDLLDGSFTIIRRRPRDVLVLAAMLVIPVEVLSVVLLRNVLGAEGFTGFADPTTAFGSGEDAEVAPGTDAALLSLGVSALSLALLAGALAVLVDGWYRGREVSPLEAAGVALRRSWALFVGVVLVKVLEAIGLLGFGVGAYLVMAMCHVVSPVITAEGKGPIAALGRSMRLTRRHMGAALAVPGLVGIVGLLVGSGFAALPELVVPLVGDDWDWFPRAVGQVVSQLIVVPFTAGVAVLFHLDLRMRVEAHDIVLRARSLLPG